MQLYSMLPGVSAQMMPEGESEAKIKPYMTMMDSMTNEGVRTFLIWCISLRVELITKMVMLQSWIAQTQVRPLTSQG